MIQWQRTWDGYKIFVLATYQYGSYTRVTVLPTPNTFSHYHFQSQVPVFFFRVDDSIATIALGDFLLHTHWILAQSSLVNY
jgi:hypothetical protein